MTISEEALYAAATEAAEKFLSTLPDRADCVHDFSPDFEARMEPLLRRQRRRRPWRALLAVAAVLLGAGAICELLPRWIPGFAVDYGFFGVFLTILLYYAGKKGIAPGMLLLCLSLGGLQWWSLAAVPLMFLYNGQRGNCSLGWMFYLYYPLHLAVLYGIAMLPLLTGNG